MNQNKYTIFIYVDERKEGKQPEGTQEDEISLEDIATDVENIRVV